MFFNFNIQLQDLQIVLEHRLHSGPLAICNNGEVYEEVFSGGWIGDEDNQEFVSDYSYYRLTGNGHELYMTPFPSKRAIEVAGAIISFFANPTQTTAIELVGLLNACEIENKTRVGWALPKWDLVDRIINAYYFDIFFDEDNMNQVLFNKTISIEDL